MKKFALWAAVLALMLSLSTAAFADYDAAGVLSDRYDSLVTEVILSQSSTAEAPSGGGMAPVAENQEIKTYRGVSVGGRVSAADADSDTLFYEVTTQPMKGQIEMASDGHFVYTPGESKRGKDYFGFRATDGEGNVSQEGTVIITLQRQRSGVCYSDLTGSACAYSATVLAEKDIFVGEQLGEDYVFHPDQAVTRGEFLSMCMVLSDTDILSGTVSTGFLDDEAIESWMKPYVSTALMEGYIQGVSASGGANFESSREISLRDACEILDAVIGITNVGSFGENQAVANLTACGVLDGYDSLDASVTRAQAADMLASALAILERR